MLERSMKQAHSLRIDYDEESGALVVIHRVTTETPKGPVSVAHEIKLDDPAGAAKALSAILDVNREAFAEDALDASLTHAVALAGGRRKATKEIRTGGTLEAIGSSEAKKL